MSLNADAEIITLSDGRTMRLALLRAQESHKLMSKKRNAIKNLTSEKKLEFYYKVYESVNKHRFEDKLDPLFQMGLSPFTFLREPILVGGFQTTYGELFSSMHQALNEAEVSGVLDKE